MKNIFCFIAILFLLPGNDLQSQNKNKPLFTFGVVADVQYADRDNAGKRYYRSSLAKFAKAVNVFNQQQVDFVLSLGDFINERKKEKDIVACHFPLYPDHGIELLWNATELRTLIETSPNVIAYLNGHVHKSQHFHENGVHYFSIRGMVEEDVNAFSVVSVFKNHLEIENRHLHQILIDN